MTTKHIMTRAEAIAMLKNHMPLSDSSERTIDFYVKAGMLELREEEKNYLMIKDMDGDIQRVEIAELILKLSTAGYVVNKCNGEG